MERTGAQPGSATAQSEDTAGDHELMAMAARWELLSKDGEFELLRDGRRVVTSGGSRERAEEQLREYREQEVAARHAMASGDALAPCRLGWHRGPLPEPIGRLQHSVGNYFRLGVEIREAGGTLVYRVAPEPFEYRARTVKCLGRLHPWPCTACKQPIDEAQRRLP